MGLRFGLGEKDNIKVSQRAENSRDLVLDNICAIKDKPGQFGSKRSLERTETVGVAAAMAECTLGTPRSGKPWSKDKISSVSLWTGHCLHHGGKAHHF